MSEPRPIASLSSTLLARKGHAKPAMRPQNYSFDHAQTGLSGFAGHDEDLGWNDLGHDAEPVTSPAAPVAIRADMPAPPVEAVAPLVVLAQQEKLAVEFAAPAIVEAPKPVVRAAPGSKPKAAFTLRLDGERHLRLRLVCAVNHRSAQQIVTQALDEFLARQPDNARLTAKR
jgi:hypothetical protein